MPHDHCDILLHGSCFKTYLLLLLLLLDEESLEDEESESEDEELAAGLGCDAANAAWRSAMMRGISCTGTGCVAHG